MEFVLLAHGSYVNQYNQFQVPNNCNVHYYQEHGLALGFDEAYDVVRGMVKEDAMELDAKSQTKPGELLVDYTLSTEGLMPVWPDIPFPSLGLYQVARTYQGYPYFIKIPCVFPCSLSVIVNGLATQFPHESHIIHVLSCRTFNTLY